MGKKDDGPIQAAVTWEERYAAWKEFWDFEKWGFNKDRKCGSSLFPLLPFASLDGHLRWISARLLFETQAQRKGGRGRQYSDCRESWCASPCALRVWTPHMQHSRKGILPVVV